RRFLAMLIATSLSFAGYMQGAQAGGLISTEAVATSEGLKTDAQARAHLLETLNRADVAQALMEHGVSVEQAKERVGALSDAEATQLAAQIDSAPAGADDVVGAIVLVFIILLITDILGYTKIFPFTRSIR